MTVVEFLDGKNLVDNVAAMLSVNPDKMYFIGDSKVWKHREHAIRDLQKKRNITTEIRFKAIGEMGELALSVAVAYLESIIREIEVDEPLIFDLNGGGEVIPLAAGIVYGRHPEKKIQIQKMNLKSGRIFDYDQDGVVLSDGHLPTISVPELVELYGGTIVRADQKSDGTIEWDFSSAPFVEDLRTMWEIVRQNPRLWNVQLTALQAIIDLPGTDPLIAVVSKAHFYDMMRKKNLWINLNHVFPKLQNSGLLKLRETEDMIEITFKNIDIKMALYKAGTVLELMSCFALYRSNRFGDALTGVLLDWDGNVSADGVMDVENEIDVIGIEGLQPIFISCKNGDVSVEELYKLQSVASRFGGPDAKKVLLISDTEKMENEWKKVLFERALAMKITVISDLKKLTFDDFLETVAKRI